MNNYSFGHKVKDNSIIIQKLTNELSLIKDKLLLSQTQLNTLTIKYQNAINKNQKLKEQNLELSKKLQNIKELTTLIFKYLLSKSVSIISGTIISFGNIFLS